MHESKKNKNCPQINMNFSFDTWYVVKYENCIIYENTK